MQKRISFVLAVLALLMPFMPLQYSRAFIQTSAESYLVAHDNNPWVTMALSTTNASNPTDYISAMTPSSATDYASIILALSSVNQDPANFGGKNYVAGLTGFAKDGQLGDSTLLNDDIFGVLALESDNNASGNANIVSDSKSFIISHQNSDGGWGYSVSAGSDTNTTASAILALLSAGVSSGDSVIQNAVNYLKTAQNSDGGFTYDPKSQWGTASDSSSTAWVIWVLDALNISPATLAQGSNDPVSYLESNQNQNGFFVYQSSSPEDSFTPVTTSYAVIALAGKTLPLHVFVPANTGDSNNSGFAFKIIGSSASVCSGNAAGPTALDIVKNAAAVCGFTYDIKNTSFGPYLDQIGTDAALGNNGWIYMVNGQEPNVGASAYNLQTGDTVLWYFGDPANPPSDASAGGSSSPVSSSVNLSADVEQGKVKGTDTSISFTLNPSTINFGKLTKQGDSSTQQISINNTSSVGINITADVHGDALFTDGLSVNGSAWKGFQDQVGAGSQQNLDLKLTLGNYAGNNGSKSGTLIFWATEQQ